MDGVYKFVIFNRLPDDFVWIDLTKVVVAFQNSSVTYREGEEFTTVVFSSGDSIELAIPTEEFVQLWREANAAR